MQYEYTMWAQALTVPWADRTPAGHAEGLIQTTASLMPLLAQRTETIGGGGWETISHDFLRLDDGAVLTVLLRRPLPGEGDEARTNQPAT